MSKYLPDVFCKFCFDYQPSLTKLNHSSQVSFPCRAIFAKQE
ncbi:hypothetical protein PALB_27020 [Pseudoalteromonas luteoviolacea B = ATCC 29581]|nr:hypothetical protein PALB_27020 [Pseudoalteromonas luteoviolacea B = ATCC 29581]